MMSDKYDIAKHAALKWMARTGMIGDPRWTTAQLWAYADELALSLTMGEGTRRAIVNGMELVHTTFGWSVVVHEGPTP